MPCGLRARGAPQQAQGRASPSSWVGRRTRRGVTGDDLNACSVGWDATQSEFGLRRPFDQPINASPVGPKLRVPSSCGVTRVLRVLRICLGVLRDVTVLADAHHRKKSSASLLGTEPTARRRLGVLVQSRYRTTNYAGNDGFLLYTPTGMTSI